MKIPKKMMLTLVAAGAFSACHVNKSEPQSKSDIVIDTAHKAIVADSAVVNSEKTESRNKAEGVLPQDNDTLPYNPDDVDQRFKVDGYIYGYKGQDTAQAFIEMTTAVEYSHNPNYDFRAHVVRVGYMRQGIDTVARVTFYNAAVKVMPGEDHVFDQKQEDPGEEKAKAQMIKAMGILGLD